MISSGSSSVRDLRRVGPDPGADRICLHLPGADRSRLHLAGADLRLGDLVPHGGRLERGEARRRRKWVKAGGRSVGRTKWRSWLDRRLGASPTDRRDEQLAPVHATGPACRPHLSRLRIPRLPGRTRVTNGSRGCRVAPARNGSTSGHIGPTRTDPAGRGTADLHRRRRLDRRFPLGSGRNGWPPLGGASHCRRTC